MTRRTLSEPIIIERPTAPFWRERAGAKLDPCYVA
jgi:hypothetical protein